MIGAANCSYNSNILGKYIEYNDVLEDCQWSRPLANTCGTSGGGGGIAKAAEQPRPTPRPLAGQFTEFAGAPGVGLLLRLARRLEEPTETGKRMLRHAEDIFSAGRAWLEVVKGRAATSVTVFRVGGDSVSKVLARRRAARPAALLADMAADKLDLIIADRPAPRAPDRLPWLRRHVSRSHVVGEFGSCDMRAT